MEDGVAKQVRLQLIKGRGNRVARKTRCYPQANNGTQETSLKTGTEGEIAPTEKERKIMKGKCCVEKGGRIHRAVAQRKKQVSHQGA